jgi:hypothetical protein
VARAQISPRVPLMASPDWISLPVGPLKVKANQRQDMEEQVLIFLDKNQYQIGQKMHVTVKVIYNLLLLL